jgi:hypothetical protein
MGPLFAKPPRAHASDGSAQDLLLSGLRGLLCSLIFQPPQQEPMLDLESRLDSDFFPNLIALIIRPLWKKDPTTRRAFLSSNSEKAYFCCSLGLSAGFGGLPWVCCCGVAGLAGACGSDAETGTVVMSKSFHEKN